MLGTPHGGLIQRARHIPAEYRRFLRDSGKRSTSGLTSRALVLGLLLAAIMGPLAPYITLYMRASNAGGAYYTNPLAHFLFLILVAVVNVAVGALRPQWALRRGELLTVYILLILANSSFTLISYLVPMLSGAFYFATPENNWAQVLHPHIPQWIMPRDMAGITAMYEGAGDGEIGDHWKVWVAPLLCWLPLLTAVQVATLTLMVVLRRQWSQNEHLPYPLIQVPLAMIEEEHAGALVKPFFRRVAMWLGFAVPVIVVGSQGLRAYAPELPEVVLSQWLPFFAGEYIVLILHFGALGFFYLVNREVAFSLWVFSLLNTTLVGLFNIVGLGSNLPAVSAWTYTRHDIAHQSIGAMVVLVLGGLWVARHHLTAVARKTFAAAADIDAADEVGDADEIVSYRTAVFALAGSVAVIACWLFLAGLPPLGIAVFLFLVFVIFVALTRLCVEAGVATLVPPLVAPDAAVAAIGSTAFGPSGIVGLIFTRVWANDILNFSMPHCANGLKLAEQLGGRRGWLFGAMLLAGLIGVTGGSGRSAPAGLHTRSPQSVGGTFHLAAADRLRVCRQAHRSPGWSRSDGLDACRHRRDGDESAHGGALAFRLVAPASARVSDQFGVRAADGQRLHRVVAADGGQTLRRATRSRDGEDLLSRNDSRSRDDFRRILGGRRDRGRDRQSLAIGAPRIGSGRRPRSPPARAPSRALPPGAAYSRGSTRRTWERYVKVNWNKPIFDNGRGWHVGDIVFWNGSYHIAFCDGTGHNSQDTQCRLMSSADLENWTSHIAISQEDAGGYVAEPQLLVVGERLMMYAGAVDWPATVEGDGIARSWMMRSETRDGETWSKPRQCFAMNHDFWHPIEHCGRYYTTADNSGRAPKGVHSKVDLLTSDDGENWTWVSEIMHGSEPGEKDYYDVAHDEHFGTPSPSETALLFLGDDRLLAIIRARGHCAALATASPPYREWEFRRSEESRCYGAEVARVGKQVVVTGRSFDNEGQRAVSGKFGVAGGAQGVFLYDEMSGELSIEALLASGGDTGYAAIQPVGDSEALIAYYSSHEYGDRPGSNIYLASITLD